MPIDKANVLKALAAALKVNQLDMIAETGAIFGSLGAELLKKVLDHADTGTGQVLPTLVIVQDWFKRELASAYDRYQAVLFEKMAIAARLPYEAEAVAFSHYFKTDTLESTVFSTTFGVDSGPIWDEYMDRQAKRNVEAALQRVYGDGLNISQRIWRNERDALSRIDTILVQGILQKKSAIELAKALEPHLNNDAKFTRWSTSRLNKKTPLDRKNSLTGLISKPNLIPVDATPPTSGVSYNALRLARNELNTIGVMATLDSASNTPWTEGLKWNLSPSHNIEDVCDSHASGGPNGDGVYPVSEFPKMPAHVQCFCFVTTVQMDPDEFLSSLKGWVSGGSWPEMDVYATRTQGTAGPGTLLRTAQSAISAGLRVIDTGKVWTAKDWITRGKIESTEYLGGGFSDTYVSKIKDDGRGVYKPEGGQKASTANLYGHTSKQVIKNEIAAGYVGEILGWDDIVPAVARRRINYDTGAFIRFWENSELAAGVGEYSLSSYSIDEARRAAIYDILIASQDRHYNNYMLHGDLEPYGIRLIDHGFSFAKPGDILNRSNITKLFLGQDLTDQDMKSLRRIGEAVDNKGIWTAKLDTTVERKLKVFLGKTRLEYFKERLGTLIGEGKMVFPESYRDWTRKLQ